MHAPSTTRNRTTPARPEAPLQAIEGQAYQIHGDTTHVDRAYASSLEHDRLHDDAADLCERAIVAGDLQTALRAIRLVKHHDDAEDGDLATIPEHTDVIRGRTRAIGATVELTERDWDRLADLLTIATFAASAEHAVRTHATMVKLIALVRRISTRRPDRVEGIRLAGASGDELQAAFDATLEKMLGLVVVGEQS